MTTPFSLANPPTAPTKKKPSLAERRGLKTPVPPLIFPEEEQRPEWRVLAESGWVREKFLLHNPEEVEKIEDEETLLSLQKWYFPASQPRNPFEETYVKLVLDAVNKKLGNC